MNGFSYILDSLYADYCKIAPNGDITKQGCVFYAVFGLHCYGNMKMTYNSAGDLYNALSQRRMYDFYYDGNNCFLIEMNDKRKVRGVCDITDFLNVQWFPDQRKYLRKALIRFLNLDGIIIYNKQYITDSDKLYSIDRKILKSYYKN